MPITLSGAGGIAGRGELHLLHVAEVIPETRSSRVSSQRHQNASRRRTGTTLRKKPGRWTLPEPDTLPSVPQLSS